VDSTTTMKTFLKSKIHRARVTSTDADYIGSIVIDSFLLEKAGIQKYEKVLIENVSTGKQWETYAIPGEKFMISVRGAGARLCKIGDVLTILAFMYSETPTEPFIVQVDKDNKFEKML
jgi:aspartate 1-decarboxylase